MSCASTSMALIPYTPPKSSKELLESILKKEPQKNHISRLPKELLLHILSLLDMKDLCTCSLVSKQWKLVSEDKSLWSCIFDTTDLSHGKTNLSHIKTEHSFMGDAWKYRDLALEFGKSHRFGMAIASCEQSAKIDPFNGAYGFRDLCQVACEAKDYNTARTVQLLAKKYLANAGNEAMSFFIKSRVVDANFLECSNELIRLAVALIDDDREFGLQALIEIAKKFADLGKFEEAMRLTQQARTLRDSRSCERGRNHSEDIHPYTKMGYHMLSLKQYKLAVECAQKIDKHYFHPEWLLSDIFIKQMHDENSINEHLLSQLKPETAPWITAFEELAYHLIDNKKFDEALKISEKRLQTEWVFGKFEFTHKLKTKLLEMPDHIKEAFKILLH